MKDRTRTISVWLLFCAGSVFLMALIGAITRLTESGLSIVEWKPVTGALPPLSPEAWAQEFALYQESPQYQQVNEGMSLSAFKKIYFWEWLHRLWGRLIGVFYFVPFMYFMLRNRLPKILMPTFWFVLLLGAMQGAMGWFMVKSGLVDLPAVSHYRLAAHLMLAVFIYSGMVWLWLSFAFKPEDNVVRVESMRGAVRQVLVLVVLTMTWGAFVAGLRAGLLYNTFPMMDGYWIPPELLQHRPIWRGLFEEPAVVQFVHRILAMVTFVKVMMLVWRSRYYFPPPRLKKLFYTLGGAVFVQVGLGVATLLTQVHIALAVAHQGMAICVLTLLIWILHDIPYITREKGT